MNLKIVVSNDNCVKNDAFKVRKAVFVEEQGFFDTLDDTDDISYHAVAYNGDQPVGCGRTFPEAKGSYHIGRIAVLYEYRNKNIGTMIMTELEKTAAMKGASFVVLSAQRRAYEFYLKLGYEQVGDEYLEEGYPHIFMKKRI